MGKVLDRLDEQTSSFILAQKVFFVATAPDRGGHVNVSPKGYDSLSVLSPETVAYLDLTGSGIETVAHLRDNGRITLMFCAFDGAPHIVRLYGRGEVVVPGATDFDALRARFPEQPGVRSIIRVALTRVATSCGYAVPILRFEAEREVLRDYADRKGADGLEAYRRDKNAQSIDGLPGLDFHET